MFFVAVSRRRNFCPSPEALHFPEPRGGGGGDLVPNTSPEETQQEDNNWAEQSNNKQTELKKGTMSRDFLLTFSTILTHLDPIFTC